MMSSLLKSHDEKSNQDRDEETQQHSSTTTTPRDLLISCAELVHRCDIPSARHAASLLSVTSSSPFGDSADRVVHQFALALSLRLSLRHVEVADPDVVQSAYLSLNQITPFLRFAHLTANQAILEALDGSRHIHILDFDTTHGLQWPPLLQAISDRSNNININNPIPFVRITGTGSDLSVLLRTADRLQTFAHSLGIPFRFHPLLLPNCNSSSDAFSFHLHPGETLAVNCVHFLSKLTSTRVDHREVEAFLGAIRAMNPAVVTVAERESDHNSTMFLQRFMESLDHYTAVFDSLEATLPPTSGDRLAVERVWFGREIADVVAFDDDDVGGEYRRRERSERFERWEMLMRGSGFTTRPLSGFAISQARLLLRLHYPSEGYQLEMVKDACFLGWKNKPLFSVSSWH